MMLHVPLDFERLPEYWALEGALRNKGVRAEGARDLALLLWIRLWVVLGYLARSTNRPGWLNELGASQLNAAATGALGPTGAVAVLAESGLLSAGGDGWHCEAFAQANGHLAPSYMPPTKRANLRSSIVRAKGNIAALALQQGLLLADTEFTKRDGTPMSPRERDRCMVLVMTLDRCVKAPGRRHQGTYTQGLMADACAVVERHDPEALQEFYYWLLENSTANSGLPDSAEAILRDWDRVWKAWTQQE